MKRKMTNNKKLIVGLMVLLPLSMPIFGAEIHDAAKQGNLAKVKSLLAEKPELVNARDKRGYTPLHVAAYSGHKEVVELLIANGAKVNAKDFYGTPLFWSIDQGHEEAANLIHKHGGTIGAEIYDAAALGNLEKVQSLLAENPKLVNTKEDSVLEMTALHWAAIGGQKEVVKLLIDKGANVNSERKWGDTPLHMAVDKGHKEVTELLIAKGADVNATQEDGFTPLHVATLNNRKDVADLLIENGAKINVKDRLGNTPLKYAVMKGHKEVADLLHKHGAVE